MNKNYGEKTRSQIEEELNKDGFELIYEWRDDQIWADKSQKNLLWISWINSTLKHYELEETQDL